MNTSTILLAEAFVLQAISLGVKSWNIIHAALEDAGLDDAQIVMLRTRWKALRDDVVRAAGG